MIDPMIATFVILGVAIMVFIWNKLPPAIVALGVALALYAVGATTFDQTIAGFGDPIIIFLAGLFVVSEALDATGVTAWAGQQLIRRVGKKRSAVLIALMLLCAALTAVISVNGAVAALVPVTVMIAIRTRQPASQLLIPLAFAAHAGSMLTLLGTPINLMVSELSVQAGARPFGFFEFALVGLPLLTGTILISLFLGRRLLPEHVPASAPRDLSRHAQVLAAEYQVDSSKTAISHETGITEIIIPPRSPFLGDHVFPGMLTESGELLVVAVHRAGTNLDSADLEVGDTLVVRGTWDSLDTRLAHPGVVAIDAPDLLRRQSVSLGPRAYIAVAVLVVMSVLLAVNVIPSAIVLIAAATIMVACRVVTVDQAQRSILLPTLVIVAGMIPMSTAIQTSGAADLIAHALVTWFGGGSPHLLLLGIVLVVLILGQFISNLATVLIVAPIAIAVSQTAHLSPLPMMMAITVAGAASFLTPIATTANLMVQEPGGYRFGDYWKLGLPNFLMFGAVAVLLVPLIWPFSPG